MSSAIELLASAAGKLECEESGLEEDHEDSSASDDESPPSSPAQTDNTSDSKSVAQVPVDIVSARPNPNVMPDDAASLGVICRRFLMLLLVSEV